MGAGEGGCVLPASKVPALFWPVGKELKKF